jgi:hypothetical protein
MHIRGSLEVCALVAVVASSAIACRPASAPPVPSREDRFAHDRDVVFASYFQSMTAGRCVDCHTSDGAGVAVLDMKSGSAADIESSFVGAGLLPACGHDGGTIDGYDSPLRWYNLNGRMPHRGAVTPDLGRLDAWLVRYRSASENECRALAPRR